MNKKFVSIVSVTLVLMFSLVVLVPVGDADTSAVKLTILHTNDEHSAVIPFDPAIDYTPAVGDDPTVGGFARLATEIDSIKTTKALENESVLTFSAGDFLMGTMFSWLGGANLTPELTLMQQMGYDAVTLGNHEYDMTSEYLASYLSAAGYPNATASMPIVASNIIIPPGHPLEAVGIQSYVVKTLPNGFKVGIFGIIGYDAQFVAPLAAPVNFSDPLETAAEMVNVLTALKVNLTICLSHSGVEEDKDMASAVPGIDIIVGGHSHDALFEPVIVGETIIVQAGAETRYLGQLELSISDTGEVSIRNYVTGNPFLIPIDDSISASPSIQANITSLYVPALNQMVYNLTGGMFDEILDVVAESEFNLLAGPPLTETGLGNLITDSMRAMVDVFQYPVTNDTVDFAFEANGVIRGSVLRGSIPGKTFGNISLYDLHAAVGLGVGPDELPGYPVISFYLTAEEIRRVCEISVTLSAYMGNTYFLQVSGLRFKYDPELILTLHSVTKIEQYVGPGPQTPRSLSYFTIYEDGIWYVDPTGLYKVAGNIYIMYFLPFIAEKLPQLAVVPKDKAGNPILDPTAAIVYQTPELKVWQAVLYYVVNFTDMDTDGIPDVPLWYEGRMGRVYTPGREPSPVGGIWITPNKLELLAPYIGLTSTIVVATAATAIYVKRVKRRKKKR